MKALFLSFVVLFACVNLGLGLKCYFGGKNSTDADDLKDKLGIVSLKSCTKTTTTVGDIVTVLRAGSPAKLHSGCNTAGHVEHCNCNTDACNTAYTSATLLLPLLILPALITHFL